MGKGGGRAGESEGEGLHKPSNTLQKFMLPAKNSQHCVVGNLEVELVYLPSRFYESPNG